LSKCPRIHSSSTSNPCTQSLSRPTRVRWRILESSTLHVTSLPCLQVVHIHICIAELLDVRSRLITNTHFRQEDLEISLLLNTKHLVSQLSRTGQITSLLLLSDLLNCKSIKQTKKSRCEKHKIRKVESCVSVCMQADGSCLIVVSDQIGRLPTHEPRLSAIH
jgi:hypothetical protein